MTQSPDFPPDSDKKPSDRLSFMTKLAYGAGDLGPAITANILSVFLMIFFTNVAGLKAGLAGSILMVGKIWDAINDPIVGVLSDRTRSRWGRRHPWMIFGAIPFGLTFVLQWLVPPLDSTGLFIYYVAIAVLFNTFYTAVNLPYTALTPELTQDYDERTSLNSFRFAFSIGGSVVSLIVALEIFKRFENPLQQYLVLAIVCGVVAIVSLFWCVAGTRKRAAQMEHQIQETTPQDGSLPYLQQLKIAFSNRPFLYVIGIYLCSWLAVQNTVSIIPYYVKSFMGLKDADFTQVVIAVQVTSLTMLFIWSQVSKRYGKKAVYFMGMAIWIIAEIFLFFLRPGQVGFLYTLAIMSGFGVSTAYLVPWSMIPDVIELDELQTGQRREGIFYGFMVLLQKVGLAIALFVVGQVLDGAGFVESVAGQPDPVQPASALTAIQWMIGPIPAVVLVAGLVLAYFYPITREVHAEILLQLAERKRSV